MTKLHKWVREQDETVTVLAARLGVGRVALHRYMSGQVMPRPDTVARIVELTRGTVTASDLQKGYQTGGARWADGRARRVATEDSN